MDEVGSRKMVLRVMDHIQVTNILGDNPSMKISLGVYSECIFHVSLRYKNSQKVFQFYVLNYVFLKSGF